MDGDARVHPSLQQDASQSLGSDRELQLGDCRAMRCQIPVAGLLQVLKTQEDRAVCNTE